MAFDIKDRIAGRLRHMVAPTLQQGDYHARILAVASSKGGVGKTTSAVNLAVAYAKRGVRVLLIDLDPQAHVAAALGLTHGRREGLADVLLGKKRDVQEVVEATRWPGLMWAGSDKALAETEMVLSAKIGKEFLLDGALATARTHHELIVFDCPPNLGTLTLNALCAADALLVPTDMSVLALEGVTDIMNAIHTVRQRLQRTVEVCGIVKTRYDKRASQVNTSVEESLADMFGDRLLHTAIPQSSSINKAHLVGEPIVDFEPRSSGALAYEALASELAPRLGIAHLCAARADKPHHVASAEEQAFI